MSKLKTKKKQKSLVVKRLESVSKTVFKKYFPLITDLVGNSPGVYALYDGDELYYVGKSIDLKKRVKQHLRDRHLASWTHFSLYLVNKAEHIHEIESLLIRIANPKGNRATPKGKSSDAMLKHLKNMVREKQKEELDEMFGGPAMKQGKAKIKASATTPKTLVGLVSKDTLLYRTYKGKEFKAILTSTGKIKLGNKTYTSPSGAAKSIVKRAANGWLFWYIKDSNGDWVKLANYS